MNIKKELQITKDMSALEFCERIGKTTIWSYGFCVEFLENCKNDRELFLECYNFSIYNCVSPYIYLSSIEEKIQAIEKNIKKIFNTPRKRPTTFKVSEIFNDDHVEIDFIGLPYMNDWTPPPKKPIKQLFIEFLKKEEVIERYKRNWLFCDFYKYERPIKNRNCYIIYAFIWKKTPEDETFWDEINNKWLEYLENVGR